MSEKQKTPPAPIHKVRIGTYSFEANDEEHFDEMNQYRQKIEPWLSALCQADHLNLLVGNGLTTAIAQKIDVSSVDMSIQKPECQYAESVWMAATNSAKSIGRNEPNIEDFIRSISELIQGFNIMLSDSNDNEKAVKMRDEWAQILNQELQSFIKKIIETEERIRSGFERFDEKGQQAQRLLLSFLLSFGSRPPSRERLHIFTTNYDRLIEYGADLVGLRIMDRFVGSLEPVFRASRLGIDMHYNPPGIRGEPRILEGVIRFTKLHGSIDWVNDSMPNQPYHVLQRCLPFGKISCFSEKPVNPVDRLMIYPNSAKDMETLIYPYAELFRDFATAVCQSNTVLFTYGYGFGDDHINRVIRDMLTIPSTHLVMISYDDADGRISKFYNTALSESQISLLVGPHFGDLSTLVDNYLPQPQIEQVKWKMAQLIKNRSVINNNEQANTSETEEA